MTTPLPDAPRKFSFLAKNFFLLGIGEFASKICSFVAFAYLARVLGPREFGQLEFALALIFFFTLSVDCGLGPYGAREIAKDESPVGHLTRHVLLLRSLLGIIAFALLIVLVMVLDKPWPVAKLVLLYGLTLLAQPGLLPWVFQGRDLMGYVAVAAALRWFLFAGAVLLLVSGPESLWIVPAIEVAAILCVVVYYFYAFKSRFGSLGRGIDFRYAFGLLRQAWPIGASELVWALKIYFATVLLGTMIYGPEVGWFAAAHRLVISLHAFVWLYFFNLLPSISRGSRGTFESLQRLLAGSLQVSGWVGVFVVVAGTVFAAPILNIVYGAQYQPAVVSFQVMLWLIPLALVSGHFRYTLIAYNKQALEFVCAACGGLLNVVINLTVIASYGILGAAIALVVAEGLICVISYLMVRRTITVIPVGASLWKPVLGALVLAGMLYMLPPLNTWIVGASAMALFIAMVALSHRTIFADLRALLGRTG